MILNKKFLALCTIPFLVAGCGPEYELVKTDTYFPYGNQRTAGSGYAYVLAKLLPEKELKLEQQVENVVRNWKPAVLDVAPEAPDTRAEEIFHEKQKK